MQVDVRLNGSILGFFRVHGLPINEYLLTVIQLNRKWNRTHNVLMGMSLCQLHQG